MPLNVFHKSLFITRRYIVYKELLTTKMLMIALKSYRHIIGFNVLVVQYMLAE